MATDESSNTEPESSQADPLNESLLRQLLITLMWFRTLEENSLIAREMLEANGNLSEEESDCNVNLDEEDEAGVGDFIKDAIWALEGAHDSATTARELLLEFRDSSQDVTIRYRLTDVRSRLKDLSDQLGTVSWGTDGASSSPRAEIPKRLATKWFAPHLHDPIHAFDLARCDLTVAIVENENCPVSGELQILPIDTTDHGFHPPGTDRPPGWFGPLSGNQIQLSRWVFRVPQTVAIARSKQN